MKWIGEAEHLYYTEKLKLVEIEKKLNKHRTTIAKALKKKDTDRFLEEKNNRKLQSKERHRERCRDRWRKINGSFNKHDDITASELQRIQAMDAAILSRDGEPKARPIMSELDYYRSAYTYSNNTYKRCNKTEGGALVPTTLPKSIKVNSYEGRTGKRRTKGGTNLSKNSYNKAIGIMK